MLIYVNSQVTEASKTKLNCMFSDVLAPVPEDAHATIVYGRVYDTSVAACELEDEAVLNLNSAKSSSALITGLQWWPGHDLRGYIVAILDSDYLHARNAVWRELCVPLGLYRPHITLVKYIEEAHAQSLMRHVGLFTPRLPCFIHLEKEIFKLWK